MRKNLRELRNKIISTLKNSAYILVPVIMFLTVCIIALTQEEPVQEINLTEGEETGQEQDLSFIDETVRENQRVIPSWVKPARWFRSNSGGMPLEEVKSRITAMRSEYALVIDFPGYDDLPGHLLGFYDDSFFVEMRTLYKRGKQDRIQWIFRDENYGVRLIAVLFETEENEKPKETSKENLTDENNEKTEAVEIAAVQKDFEKTAKGERLELLSGFIEIFDDKYNMTTEYDYSEKGDKTKIDYIYNNNTRVSANAFLWDAENGGYIHTYTDYYRYNRSSFLRTVERVFMTDMQNSAPDNFVKVSFPINVIAAARNNLFMGERFNAYPEFFGDLFVLKDSKIVFSTDDHGRVLEQTLVNDDEKHTVVWKIVNTWSGDRIVKITKTEGDTVFLAEYEYNKSGERILERNIKNGVLERVVRTDGKTDIEELYLDNKLALRAVWEDGRKISETRITKN